MAKKTKSEPGERKAPAKGGAKAAVQAAGGKPAPQAAGAKGAKGALSAGGGGKVAGAGGGNGYVPRLLVRYRDEVVPRLQREFGIANVMAVPRIVKISVNMGVGEAIANIKILDDAAAELGALAGQRPVITRAHKSIAAFKLREGMPIGARVTLRGTRMWDFLDRLISVALPRVRDFRGVPTKSFDGRGNFTLGVRDHLIFPEVDYSKVERSKGLNVTIVTTAGNDERALFLLRELGMPFAPR
jgi:large subunit ribosomal protein L5